MKRDPFIDVFAWLMLGICGVGTAIGLLLTALLFEPGSAGRSLPVAWAHSSVSVIFVRHLPLFTLAFVAYSITGLVASIGLLRGGRPWARKLWTVLLTLEIGWTLAIMSHAIAGLDRPGFDAAAGSVVPTFSSFGPMLELAFSAVAITVSAWLIHRLHRSPEAAASATPAAGTDSRDF